MLFLVELGAAISVASTMVPVRSSSFLPSSRSVTVCRICSASLCVSSKWRKRRMVLSSGVALSHDKPAKSRNSGMSCSASSMAGSLRVINHCCMKWMRSNISTGNGGRPLRPSGAYGAISASISLQGTTCCICSRNSRLRVFLVERFRPRSVCCMGRNADAPGTQCKHMR